MSEVTQGSNVPRSHAESSATGNTRANKWRIEFSVRWIGGADSDFERTWARRQRTIYTKPVRLEAFFFRRKKAAAVPEIRHRRLTR